jgi:hypothetical protein
LERERRGSKGAFEAGSGRSRRGQELTGTPRDHAENTDGREVLDTDWHLIVSVMRRPLADGKGYKTRLTIQPIRLISSLNGIHTPTPIVLPVVTNAVMDPLMNPRKPAGEISELIMSAWFDPSSCECRTYQYPGDADSTSPTPT